ncbi:MAG: hemolysin family protein [Bacteroidales bacterium]
MYFNIAISTLLLLSYALLYALQSAFVNFNLLQFEFDKRADKRYAPLLERLLEEEQALLFSLKLASNLILVLFGGSIFLLYTPTFISFIVAFVALILGGIVLPSYSASRYPHFFLSSFIYLLKGIYTLFLPFTKKAPSSSNIIEREESSESEIFQNALNFSDIKVKECMIPRTEICALSIDSSYEELTKTFVESKFSRIIIFKENIDQIVGYIHSKDLFFTPKAIDQMLRPISSFNEEFEAQKLLSIMTKQRSSIAVVHDQYGGTAGIVTLEDLIEEIFGEISDELDREEYFEKVLPNGEFIFSGRLELKYLNRSYDLQLPEGDSYETLGGFITWFNEDIPSQGESLSFEKWHFTILKVDSNRIESVRVKIVEE